MASKPKAISAASIQMYQYLTSTFPTLGMYNILVYIILKALDYCILYIYALNQRILKMLRGLKFSCDDNKKERERGREKYI